MLNWQGKHGPTETERKRARERVVRDPQCPAETEQREPERERERVQWQGHQECKEHLMRKGGDPPEKDPTRGNNKKARPATGTWGQDLPEMLGGTRA